MLSNRRSREAELQQLVTHGVMHGHGCRTEGALQVLLLDLQELLPRKTSPAALAFSLCPAAGSSTDRQVALSLMVMLLPMVLACIVTNSCPSTFLVHVALEWPTLMW